MATLEVTYKKKIQVSKQELIDVIAILTEGFQEDIVRELREEYADTVFQNWDEEDLLECIFSFDHYRTAVEMVLLGSKSPPDWELYSGEIG